MMRTSMMTMSFSTMAGIALLAVVGCGGTDPVGGSGATTGPEPWWDTTTDGTGPASVTESASASASASSSASAGEGSTSPPEPGDSSGEDESEDESESETAEEDEVGIYGWSTVEPGVSFDGMEGEFIAFVGGQEVCLIFWEYESGTPNDTCAECTFAFDIVRTEPVVEVDEGCADYIDPAMIPTMVSLGYTEDELLMMHDGTGWVEAGFAEFLPEKGNEFAWFIPYAEK